MPEVAPTPAEVAAEIAELGVLVAESGWRAAGRLAELGMVAPARLLARIVGGMATPATSRLSEASRSGQPAPEPEEPELRERGAELLRRSADVGEDQLQHPAFRRILDELAPDEARILRLLMTEGEQPVVDIKSGLPGSGRTFEAGLSMVAAAAGCLHPDRIGLYFANLARLGLAEVCPEPVADPLRYQLLEAQPEVVEALSRAGRLGRTERRCLSLTGFGRDFCRECLPSPEGP